MNPGVGSRVPPGVTSNATNELCRMMLVTPSSSLEVAVPSDVPLYDLLPTLMTYAGQDLADVGVEHDGWVLQRLGEPALDEERTLSALAVRDGESLYLSPRRAELPVIDYDDLITGVADGVRGRPDRWRDAMTRRLFLLLMAGALAAAWTMLLMPGPPLTRAATAAGLALALHSGAAVVARAMKDTAPAGLIALFGVVFAGLAGYLAVGTAAGGVEAAQVLAAGFAALAATVLALVLVGGLHQGFAALLTVSAAVSLGGLLDTATTLNSAQSASVLLVVALVFNVMVPGTSFRLADLRMPLLPSNSEELQQEIEPMRATWLLERAAVADRFMTGLFAAVGLVVAGTLPLVALGGTWEYVTLLTVSCVALLLRSRILIGAGQRIALLAPAVLGLLMLIIGAAWLLPFELRLLGAVSGTVVTAGVLLAGARILPGRRLLPYWGRAAEILELLVGLAMLPLLLAILDAYGWAQALFG